MLRGIRKASANWLGRAVMAAVMGLLALSFAIWGINDIFRGFGRSTLAKIGSTEISIEAFRQAYQERLQQIGRQIGHPLTSEQANAIGIAQQVLSEMVAEAGLDQLAARMRLGISDAEIVRRITSDPAFRAGDGKFDRVRFEHLLRNAGYSEQRFVAEQRRVMLRRQIIDSLSGSVQVPKDWLDAINQFQNQERSIEYVALGPAQVGEIPEPTNDELAKYFEARKILFRAPEYRKIVTVQLTLADLAKWMEVSDADVKRAFDEHRSRYLKPERRHVKQIVFPNMQDAESAGARIKGGLSFEALAAERGLKEQDTDLGTVSKADIIDPAVAEAAFSLKEGEVSAPVQGRFGAVIVTVTKIEPEESKTLAEVAPQIRNDIATERAKAEVQSMHDKMEDDRGSGTSLEQAAQKLKLPVVTYDVDRSGRDPTGKPVYTAPHAGEVISAAFASDVGVENDPIEADGGYIWYDVAGITPARDRTLDEVKKEVEDHWHEDEVATRLRAKAADFLDKLKAGNPLDATAKASGLTVMTGDKLRRGRPTTALSAKTIEVVFHTTKDGFGSAPGDKPTEWIVFRVTDVTTSAVDPASAEVKRTDEAVRRQIGDDIYSQYMAWLENDLGVTINRAALAQVIGSGVPDTD